MQGAFGASNVAVQGVDYPADVNGAISGAQAPKSAAGAMNMAMMAQKVQTSCPSSKVMLAGYSQVSFHLLRRERLNLVMMTGC